MIIGEVVGRLMVAAGANSITVRLVVACYGR
jgi:hypothetical protein